MRRANTPAFGIGVGDVGTALIRRVPDIGETFMVKDRWSAHRYRVCAWMRKDSRGQFQFCLRDNAEYICGSGVAGIIRPVADIVIDGKVSWPEAVIEEHRRQAVWLVGRP